MSAETFEVVELRAWYADMGDALNMAGYLMQAVPPERLIEKFGVPTVDAFSAAIARQSARYHEWREGRCDFCLTPGDEVFGPVEAKYGVSGKGAAHRGCFQQNEYDRAEDHRDREEDGR